MDLGKLVTTPLARAGAAAQNALEVARFGGLETGEEPSPFEVVEERPVYRLRRYFAGDGDGDGRPPIILVPPMMLAAEVYDVSPQATGVGVLHEHGVDPWVVDFGAPDREEGGLERTLADHVLAVSDAVDRVREATGRDPILSGYSQGGMFCYQAAAYRRGEGIDSLVTFGSPADTSKITPLGIPAGAIAATAGFLADNLPAGLALPAWASRTGFRLLDPAKSLRSQLNFILQLHDRERLLPREGQRRFLESEGWVAWPGPALADLLRQFVAHNRMLEGGFTIGDRLVTLADITCPILTFVGEVDEIAPAPSVRAIRAAAPRSDIYEVALRAGHFGLVVGSTAAKVTWPVVAGWAHWHADEDGATLPDAVRRIDADERALVAAENAGGVPALELALGAGVGVAKSFTGSASRTVRGLRELSMSAATQLPRLSRLGQIRETTQISLGLLLDEQARHTPDGVFFLFEDRAQTHASAKNRIDAVVAGLLSLGIRQGEHIGVLMETRPSALVVAAALNRLGAVAVLLRPDGNVPLEARVGRAKRIVADPEHAELALTAEVDVLVLGGGAEPRDLGRRVIDMERIDPDEVVIPSWYRPNPGRARDLAFILFTGTGDKTRMNRITNGRWALSAFGTASSAALSERDTVYSVTPLHHSSAVLMSLGGAIGGGARIALAQRFDPETFWDEVRRYGVTVASYTWTMFDALVDAPPHPGELHHPLRLLIGSGMPPALWERVERRFAPARVLEFYASAEGEAILVNLTSSKPGSVGRPLPGAAPVRIAAWDVENGRLKTGSDGFAQSVGRNAPGMLLAGTTAAARVEGETPLRGVFAAGDAWVATGDLFRRDDDGDMWFVDRADALVRTEEGYAAPMTTRNALAYCDGVDLAIAFGMSSGDGTRMLVAAATLLDGVDQLDADAVTTALSLLEPAQRPAIVYKVDEMPITSWFRPDPRPLREAGLPGPGPNVLGWDQTRERYRPLTAAKHKRLVAGRAA